MKIDKWRLSQVEMQEKIQQIAKVNVVTCGNCGSVIFQDLSKKKIKCGNCGFKTKEPSDFPDYWCRGQELVNIIVSPSQLIRAKKFLSGDEEEIRKMIVDIITHQQPGDLIDYITDVVVCEDFETRFTAKQFLDIIN